MAKTKAAAKKSQRKAQETPAGEQEVTICRRRSADRRKSKASAGESPQLTQADENEVCETVEETEMDAIGDADSVELPPERRKVQRRRQIDPTTCERDYTDDEIQFMHALDAYKRSSGRMFPTCSEILEVVRGLGYEKVDPSELEIVDVEADDTNSADADTLVTEADEDLEFVSQDELTQ